jgi:hypothetical protein
MFFSLCIPTIDRYDTFLSKYLPKYLDNELINEIIISDENGNDINKIQHFFPNNTKLKLFKNNNVLGPFLNKINACSKASNEWITLIDSDNFADINYFMIAKMYIEQNIKERKNIILAPCKANPNFNYSHLSGFIYKKTQFHTNNNLESRIKNNNHTHSEVLMNTGNYIINKYLIQNLNLSNEINNIQYSSACDVIYMNTLFFEQLDLNMHIVPNMEYTHVVHNDSIYTKTCNNFRNFNNEIYERYKKLI